ncbi:MAG: PDZ domain-containing protein, partial [Pyrinomonadaceae bacterium]
QKRAGTLGLKLESDEQTFGGTPGAKGVSLNLTGAELVNQTIFAAPTEPLEPSIGRTVDGILGYDLFNSYVVEIDYLARRLNLYQPQDYRYQGPGEIIPITVEDNTPFMRARLTQPAANSAVGKFLIDTGANGAINVFAPFDNAHKFSNSLTKALQSTGVGFTSKSQTRTGRIERLQLGRLMMKNVVATFPRTAQGESSEDEAGDGEIGGELLRRFKVIIDSSRARIILEPNARFAEPFQGSLTGVSIAAEGPDFKTFKARSVFDNSPAAEAGLRAGDIITAINGQPAARLTAEQLRQMFRREGRNYNLNIRRGDKSLRVSLKTRRLI